MNGENEYSKWIINYSSYRYQITWNKNLLLFIVNKIKRRKKEKVFNSFQMFYLKNASLTLLSTE